MAIIEASDMGAPAPMSLPRPTPKADYNTPLSIDRSAATWLHKATEEAEANDADFVTDADLAVPTPAELASGRITATALPSGQLISDSHPSPAAPEASDDSGEKMGATPVGGSLLVDASPSARLRAKYSNKETPSLQAVPRTSPPEQRESTPAAQSTETKPSSLPRQFSTPAFPPRRAESLFTVGAKEPAPIPRRAMSTIAPDKHINERGDKRAARDVKAFEVELLSQLSPDGLSIRLEVGDHGISLWKHGSADELFRVVPMEHLTQWGTKEYDGKRAFVAVFSDDLDSFHRLSMNTSEPDAIGEALDMYAQRRAAKMLQEHQGGPSTRLASRARRSLSALGSLRKIGSSLKITSVVET